MPSVDPRDALASLWREVAGRPGALADVALPGHEPALPSSFAVGTAAQVTIAASALAAAELWRLRTGRSQRISVDMRHAATEFRSDRYCRPVSGEEREVWDKTAGAYLCGDGRWVRLHTNFPHHRERMLTMLGADYDRASVQRVLEGWKAEDVEQAAAEAGAIAAKIRTFEEWDAHPHGRAVAGLPTLSIERIDSSPAMPLFEGDRPLSGIRVMDITTVIAGPVSGRTLAAHGAEVMTITSPNRPSMEGVVIDGGRGKLSAQIDIRTPAGRSSFEALLRESDVFIQGYRPGALEELGFGPSEAARIRPGLVYVSLCAYGTAGPWSGRRGFDSIVQAASGINDAETVARGAATPQALPAQALDHGSGYLMALGAMIALGRRATEGGSWHVQVSLAQTGRWVRNLGRVEGGLAAPNPGWDDVRDLLEERPSGFGPLLAVRHAAQLSETPAHWVLPTVPLGTHPPVWPTLTR